MIHIVPNTAWPVMVWQVMLCYRRNIQQGHGRLDRPKNPCCSPHISAGGVVHNAIADLKTPFLWKFQEGTCWLYTATTFPSQGINDMAIGSFWWTTFTDTSTCVLVWLFTTMSNFPLLSKSLSKTEVFCPISLSPWYWYAILSIAGYPLRSNRLARYSPLSWSPFSS